MKYSRGEIHEGDCLEIMKGIEDASVDMILCDLPYGTTNNKWDFVIPLKDVWKEYKRVIKENGVIALTSQGIFTAQLIMSNPEWFAYKYVWVKSNPTNFLNAKRQPLRQYEDICIFYKKQPIYNPVMSQGKPYDSKGIRNAPTENYNAFKPVATKSDGARYPIDVMYCKSAIHERSDRKVYHATQKPIALGRYLIRMYSNEGDVIMDNTFGSGSFLVSAVLENRKFIGIEKKPEYVNIALERLLEAEEKLLDKSEPEKKKQTNYKGLVNIEELVNYDIIGENDELANSTNVKKEKEIKSVEEYSDGAELF